MSDFIINTPNHMRWWLPDRRHQFNAFIYGEHIHLSVIDSRTHETRQSHTLKLEGDWENLCHLAAELAAKKYPSRSIHKAPEFMQRWSR